MQRFSSFRDFDWMLLSLVLLMSIISVLEIRSATLHTKFHDFDHKQVAFLLVGFILMFLISFIDYHRLVDLSLIHILFLSGIALIRPRDPGFCGQIRARRGGCTACSCCRRAGRDLVCKTASIVLSLIHI